MSKIIIAPELASIISGLINDPSGMGALDDAKTYKNFLKDAAELVANYCGGEVSNVCDPMGGCEDGFDFNAEYAVAIRPNDNLPGLTHTIWGAFDVESEDDDETYIADSGNRPMVFRGEFRDWLVSSDGLSAKETSSLSVYQVTAQHSVSNNNLAVEVFADGDDTPALSVIVEIGNDKPLVHIGTGVGDDLLLHVASVDGKLMVSHESYTEREEVSNIHTYNDRGYSIAHREV